MRWVWTAVWVFVGVGCRHEVAVEPSLDRSVKAQALPTVWVDAQAVKGGDGSQGRPYAVLQDALAEGGRRVVVAPGVYPGPFVLPNGTVLVGSHLAVLTPGAGSPLEGSVVVRGTGRFRLEGLCVQGGGVGVWVEQAAELVDLEVRGQRSVGVRAGPGASLRFLGGTVRAAVSSGIGVELGRAEVWLQGLRFEGPFAQAVRLEDGASLRAEQLTVRDAVVGVLQAGGTSRLKDVEVSLGRGPGISLQRGKMELEDLRVDGHEYGLVAQKDTTLDARRMVARRSERAGVALIFAQGHLTDVRVEDPGSFGAIQSIHSDLVLETLTVVGATDVGLTAVDGTLDLRHARIEKVRDTGSAGDGVQIRGSRARVVDLEVKDVEGSGLLVAQGAQVEVDKLRCRQCKWAGVFADKLGRVIVDALEVEGSPGVGVAVVGKAEVTVGTLGVQGLEQGPVWAECDQGARVKVGRLRAPQGPVPSCVTVERWEPPVAPAAGPGPQVR